MIKSFKEKVEKFWAEFVKEEPEIRTMMDNKVQGRTLLDFVSNILNIAFKNVYFEMGINKEGKYELILTPEGDRAKLLQIHYWLQRSPRQIWEKWNFYSSKPGHPNSDFGLTMFDVSLSKNDAVIYYEIDQKRPKINIQVLCPPLMALEESKRYSMFFIFLDQFVGELYTMEYIGYIDFVEIKQDKPFVSIDQFKALIERTIKERDWHRIENPAEIFSGYQMTPTDKKDWVLREDVISGYTSCIPLLNAFYDKNVDFFNNFREDGVVFGFVFFENGNIPKENMVNFRGEIEDRILEEVQSKGIADSIGGATGFHFSYIDFIIYDIDSFIGIAKRILQERNLDEVGFSNFIFGDTPQVF